LADERHVDQVYKVGDKVLLSTRYLNLKHSETSRKLHRKNPEVPSILKMYCRTYLPDGLECRETAFPIAGHVFSNRIGAEWHSRCRSGTLRLMIWQLDSPPGSALAGHKQVHQKCYGVLSVLRIYVCCRGSADCTAWDVSAWHEVPGGGYTCITYLPAGIYTYVWQARYF
jgi:hypothetical protein